MRITNQLQNQLLTGSIARNQSDVYRLQEQISSGERMKVASDDPANWAAVSRLQQEETDLSRFDDAANMMGSRLASMDTMLNSIGDLLLNASELAVQAGQGTLNNADRAALSESVNQLLEDLVVQGNTKYAGQYMCGGIQSSTPPFEAVRDADGMITSVSYVGSEDVATVEIGENEFMDRQLVGGGANGVLISTDNNAFDSLVALRDQLNNGENAADTGAQEPIDDSFNRVLVSRATTGAQMERLDLLAAFRSEQLTQIKEQIADRRGVDVTEAISKLSTKNVAYEAVLAMTSKVLNMSLLKYI